MQISTQLAKHIREFHFGNNWTWSSLKDSLAGIDWQTAVTKLDGFNTIAALTYHIHYFVHAVLGVLDGNSLNAHDKFSFDHPPLQSQEDWEQLLQKIWKEAEDFANKVEQLPDARLWELMADEKYGDYYRNIQGIIEHSYYHLGQIVLIKKMITKGAAN